MDLPAKDESNRMGIPSEAEGISRVVMRWLGLTFVHELQLTDVGGRETTDPVVGVDDPLFAAVDGGDGLRASSGESRGAVVHHGGKIVGGSEGVDAVLFVEVEGHLSVLQISQMDSDVSVPIWAALFVEHAK